jgi:trk system potassium uptake protein
VLLLAGGTAVVAASVLIADDVSGLGTALREAAFSVVSMMTTTAFITGDFDAYNDFARLVIVSLTFIGACAGSTAGGMKVVRFLLLSRTAVQEVRRQLQPSAVQVLRLPGRVFGEDVGRTVLGFFFVYVSVWALGMLVMAAVGLDAVTAGSASAAALNLSGAGLEAVGATENFGAVPPAGRAALSLLMLIGRLEVFTVVALLTPAFLRRRWA